MGDIRLFRYRQGRSILHRLPPWLKIILMFACALASFSLPTRVAALAWPLLIVVAIGALRFRPRDIAEDSLPAVTYLALLLAASVIVNAVDWWPRKDTPLWRLLLPPASYRSLFVHLGLSLQISSLFYRSTSSGQFHEGFCSIERALTRRQATPVADLLALTITFIPRIADFWQRLDTAWRARAGGESRSRIRTLCPILFRLSMREAWEKAQARQNRAANENETVPC